MHIGFLYDRGQCLLRRASWLQEGGVVAALAQFGHAQPHRAGACLPRTITVAVAAVQALRVLLVVAGTAKCLGFHVHQALSGELHHLAQHVHIGALLGQLGQCHSCVGHRGSLFKDQGWYSHLNPIRDHDDHPSWGSRRRAASRYGLRPTGFTLRALPRLKTYTTSWDAALCKPDRPRVSPTPIPRPEVAPIHPWPDKAPRGPARHVATRVGRAARPRAGVHTGSEAARSHG